MREQPGFDFDRPFRRPPESLDFGFELRNRLIVGAREACQMILQNRDLALQKSGAVIEVISRPHEPVDLRNLAGDGLEHEKCPRMMVWNSYSRRFRWSVCFRTRPLLHGLMVRCSVLKTIPRLDEVLDEGVRLRRKQFDPRQLLLVLENRHSYRLAVRPDRHADFEL